MIVGPGRADHQDLHHQGHRGHPRHRQGQGQGHGEAHGKQGAVQEHAPQGDKVHLGEVDDAHGVVHHPETQGYQGVNGPAGEAGKNELEEVLHYKVRKNFRMLKITPGAQGWQGKRRQLTAYLP